MKKRSMDKVILLHLDVPGKCRFDHSESIASTLGKNKASFLRNSLHRTSKVVKEDCPELWDALVGRKIRLRISDTLEGTICLLPHELAMNGHLLDFENEAKHDRENMLVGELECALFHLCNPHFHISQARIHSLHFYASHRDILASTVTELKSNNHVFGASEWRRALRQI